MKLMTTTALAAVLAFPAVAEQTDIDQVVAALQTALNTIEIGDDASEVSMAATNAANLISLSGEGEDLDDVTQNGAVAQIAVNDFDTDAKLGTPMAELEEIDQSATNVLNSIQLGEPGQEINTLTQGALLVQQTAENQIDVDPLGAGGFSEEIDQDAVSAINLASLNDVEESLTQEAGLSGQSAFNDIDVRDGLDDVTQDATNVINSASIADDLDGPAVQNAAANTQGALNNADKADAGASINDLIQAATNVSNSITVGADTEIAGSIEQNYLLGNQDAANFIEFETAGLSGEEPKIPEGGTDPEVVIDQSALNAVNMASVTDMGAFVSQSALFSLQNATNTATGPSGYGNVDNFGQQAMNVANILSAGSLPDISGTQEVTQTFGGQQNAVNTLAFGNDLLEVTQAATNVANSVSTLTE